MSSTASSTASATSSSTSPSQSGGSGNGTASNSLYLFTFLTTLLLLLAVSCGIVLRSFILRRRFRRRVEAAIAAGVLLPEQVEALRRRGPTLGEKPTIWEVRIGKGGPGYDANGKGLGDEYDMDTKDGRDKDNEEDDWANVMPISATIIPASKKNATPAPVSVPLAGSTPSTSSGRRSLWPRRSNPSFPASAPPTTSPSDAQSPTSPTSPGDISAAEIQDKLQLTVLIAMPNANAPRYKPSASSSYLPEITEDVTDKGKRMSVDSYDDEEEEEIPEVVFGLTEVLWEAGPDWTPNGAAEDENRNPNPTAAASAPHTHLPQPGPNRAFTDYGTGNPLFSSAPVAGGHA